MNWWGWVIVGAIFLGAELTWVSAQFYLVFVGVAALCVGLVAGLFPGSGDRSVVELRRPRRGLDGRVSSQGVRPPAWPRCSGPRRAGG